MMMNEELYSKVLTYLLLST